MAKLDTSVADLSAAGIRVLYLEDLRTKLGLIAKGFGLLASVFPKLTYMMTSNANHDSVAVILFTSGSEGTPKGVVLSHANIQANRFQLASRVDFGPQDCVFNCLPMFHAFGLTGAASIRH